MAKAKVAVFHLGFFYSGGGERLVLEEIRGLRSRGWEVTAFAPVVDKKLSYPELIADMDIKPLLPQLPVWFPSRESVLIIASCFLLPFIVYKFRSYDVVFAANQPGPWFGLVIKKLLGKPYLIYLAQPTRMLHPRPVDLENGFKLRQELRLLPYLVKLAKPFISWADRQSVRGALMMLTGGEYIGKILEQTYGKKRTVCYAGCHPFSEGRLNYGRRWSGRIKVNGVIVKKPYILLTNRHIAHKRFEYAISALPAVLRDCPDARLVITGEETDYTQVLRLLVKRLSLENKIDFIGFVGEKDLVRLYSQAAVYVYPSPQEDFGMGVVEAMAAGTPVVAWNYAGPTDTVIDGKTGFLSEPYDILSYAANIIKLLKSPKLVERMGRAGWRRAREKFSYRKHLEVLENGLFGAVGKR